MSFLPPSGGVVRLAHPGRSEGGPGRVFHADGRSVLKVQTGLRNQKSLHKQTEKALPFWEASSSVLCSDSICSKTAPIAPNALRIEPKYLCDLFSIFNYLVSISWVCMGCQQLFTIAKQFQQDAIEQIENFGKMLNRTKYRYERRGYYTFAQQRAKRLADRSSLYHLPAFVLPALLPERGPGGGFGQPSPSQRNNSRKRLFGPDVGASAGLYLPALAGMA